MNRVLSTFPDAVGEVMELGGASVVAISAAPDSWQFVPCAPCFLIHLSPQSEWHIAVGAKYGRTFSAPAGHVQVLPKGEKVAVRWANNMECLLIIVSEAWLADFAGEENTATIISKMQDGSLVDPIAVYIAKEVRKEIMMDGLARFECVNSWLTLLMCHLVRSCSTSHLFSKRFPLGGLSSRARRKVEDHLDRELSQRVSLKTMAKVAQLSISHFTRAFRTTFGVSPHQYVLGLRLTRARQWIIESDKPFKNIAEATGFSNSSHLTAAMRKHFGMTPSQLRATRSYDLSSPSNRMGTHCEVIYNSTRPTEH